MTKKKNTQDLIINLTQSIVEHLDIEQFDAPSSAKRTSGENNPYYNKDACYFYGGVLAQIGWSLASKKKYLDEIQYSSNLETENNPNKPDAGKSDKVVKAEASYNNGLFIYDLFENIFSVVCDRKWNQGKSTADFGQKWFADYKEYASGETKTNTNHVDTKKAMMQRLTKA